MKLQSLWHCINGHTNIKILLFPCNSTSLCCKLRASFVTRLRSTTLLLQRVNFLCSCPFPCLCSCPCAPVCLDVLSMSGKSTIFRNVSDPDLVGSAFKFGLDPDPYSESGSRIQMSKNRLKKPKFTVTHLKDENRKMLRLSLHFNHSFLSLFQELTTLGSFLLSSTVKKLSHRMEICCWLWYRII